MNDIVKRLREADRNSVQRTLGSRIFGEAANRIEALEATLRRIQRGIDCSEQSYEYAEEALATLETNRCGPGCYGDDCTTAETPEENPRLRPIGFCPECLMAGGAHKLRCSKAPTLAETDCEHEWETLGVPEGSIRCKKCEKHDSSL